MPLRLLCLHGWGTNQKVSEHTRPLSSISIDRDTRSYSPS